MNEYKRAADYLKEYVKQNRVEIPTSASSIKKELEYFQKTYAPEVLETIEDAELLQKMFYTIGYNADALCCYIEMNKECKSYFGSISGGSAYKFGLFQKKETGKWTTGSPLKSQDLSEDKALELGKKIRDVLVEGARTIRHARVTDVSSYETLDMDLKKILGDQMYNWSWIHKYFSLICNDKLSGFHSNEWQYFVLRALRIKPSNSYYVRSGQISMVQNNCGWYYRELFDVITNRFGSPRKFLRVETATNEKNYAAEWAEKKVVGMEWPGLGDLTAYEDNKGISKETVQNKLKELYFSEDEKSASRKAGEIIRFYKADKDTVFVVANGEKLVALAECEGDYFFDPTSEMAHQLHADWKYVFEEDERLPVKNEGKQSACYAITDDDNLLFLYDRFYYGTDKGGSHEYTITGIDEKMKKEFSHNTILYGPPGTGKTYSAVIYAVAMCDERSVEDVQTDEYGETLARYCQLENAGRIVFTTFHQSYGYEEFIEGIRPVMADDESNGNLQYVLADGLFKNLCKAARTPEAPEVDHNASIWFVWLKDKGSNDLKSECFRDGEIRFDGPENLGEEFEWEYSRLMKMKPGDFVLTYYGSSTLIDGVGIVQDGDFTYNHSRSSYNWTRKVKWLITEKQIDVKAINSNKYLPNFNVAAMNHMNLSDLLRVVEENSEIKFGANEKPYVMIIDEINRGNISKIFGELITLIEDRKRAGAAEAMEAVLPYSGEAFSVPDNVYILGTMNTADRSIALMDTALRRRFSFAEMMPDPSILKAIGAGVIEDREQVLDVARMLEVINTRIEYLYDREHTIGHAFFTKLANDPSVENLASIFEKKVIPLLQEYFYEDYEKIQLVLGDNDKPDEYKFILDREVKVKDVFNGNPDVDLPEKEYSIQREAFGKILSYKLIGKDI